MRDTTHDTDRITRILRWIHNNLPGEPRDVMDPGDQVIRLLQEHRAATAQFTRADVARLRAGASHMTEEGWRGDDERDFVIALAAKLASLLPPEGE